MRVLVTGSTQWSDAVAIRRELAKLAPGCTVVHGDCDGVDALAAAVARELGHAVELWQKNDEDYRRYQRGAWKGLNERMLASGVTLVLAFHPGLNEPGQARGSRHLIELAETAGVEVRAFTS